MPKQRLTKTIAGSFSRARVSPDPPGRRLRHIPLHADRSYINTNISAAPSSFSLCPSFLVDLILSLANLNKTVRSLPPFLWQSIRCISLPHIRPVSEADQCAPSPGKCASDGPAWPISESPTHKLFSIRFRRDAARSSPWSARTTGGNALSARFIQLSDAEETWADGAYIQTLTFTIGI